MSDKFLYVIDGTAIIFRNYHANFNYFLNSNFHDTSALSGTITSINSYIGKVFPTNVVVVFDPKGGTFRNEIYAEYKQNRSRPDEQLLWQLERIPELLEAMGFPVYIVPGYEADDVIGTIAKYHSAQGVEVLIESKDKDFVQLIDKNISLADTLNDSLYDYKNGDRKFGVPIERTIDFLAICGDSIDNIPGVKGVGEKTASGLINTYGGIEQIYQAIDEDRFTEQVGNLKPQTLAKKMLASRENAFLSYKLATINTHVPMENIELDHMLMRQPNVTKVLELLEEYELFSIRNSFVEGKLSCLNYDLQALKQEVEAYLEKHSFKTRKQSLRLSKLDIKNLTVEQAKEIYTTGLLPDGTPLMAASSGKRKVTAEKSTEESTTASSKATYQATAEDKELLKETRAFSGKFTEFAQDVTTSPLLMIDPFDFSEQEVILGFSAEQLSKEEIYSEHPELANLKEKFYHKFKELLIASPLLEVLKQAKQVSLILEKNTIHKTPVVLNILLESGEKQAVVEGGEPEYKQRQLFSLEFAKAQIFLNRIKHDEFVTLAYFAFKQAFAELVFKPLLAQEQIPVLTADLKDLAHEFNLSVAEVNAVGANVHDLRLVGYTRNSGIKDNSLVNLAKEFCKLEFAPIKYLKTKVDLESIYQSCQQATMFMPLFYRLATSTLNSPLYQKMEQPLWKYLYTMETNGILVDIANLESIVADLQEEIKQAEQDIYQAAGMEFNPNSPKQTADVLYNHLLLTDPTGKGSTAAEVLTQLDHPVIAHILNYRSLTTILASHVIPLIELAQSSKDQKIHTTFLQTQTVTGRLSSQDPNLQNVPAVANIAKRIRASFIAPPGYKMVSLDYSQIELRVSASLSQDEHMLEAFNHGEDIHARTASKLFNVPVEEVERSQRQIAKAINFGLNYGKTAFSLATELGISRQQASAYINEYFATYPKIKDFITQTIDKAMGRGFAQTIYGRIIPLPYIFSGVRSLVESEKRNATNYPIQGSASEIIKLAMIEIQKEITSCMPEVISHLQVHDELVFSIPETLVEKYVAQIKQVMETSVSLPGVKLKVEASIGSHWTK
ncbi:DNA polymerase I [Psittacicella gerlachiana]|uniref:DNA polymerase I n=1 Tax=Psittacicella gerlachiana TaxID=2028574 RepID=A0A3A1YJL8_9GAMM|nr:DNA polymerase I [Psittacicella gerlachiana]RIY36434.1 DNA polymerase I [Psittacicella gerlachiana]